MKKMKIRSAVLMAILLYTCMISLSLNTMPVNTPPLNSSDTSSESTSKDTLIINDPNKYAYFGWYKPTSFSITIWELLNRTVLWASSYTQPNETKMVFFREPTDIDAIGVYNWLITGGYLAENIVLHPTTDAAILLSNYYNDSDLVIYWNTYGYNSTNIISSTIPFITVSAMQTDEMGIGSGSSTKSASNDTFYIVNNKYYPTENYPLGPLILDDSYKFEATEASADGKVLIQAEVESIATQVEISIIQDIEVQTNGSAKINFTITIPESPLADLLRKSFFSNTSSLQPDVEYDVPENITVTDETSLEKGIKTVALQGDVSDSDGQVEREDLEFIARNIGSMVGDEDWNAELDLNWDGKIDIKDLAIAARNYEKTLNNTGSLYIAGYYNGTLVNCTNVYYRGPEGSAKINISKAGYIWHDVFPGSYTIYGTYNNTEKSIDVLIKPKSVTYTQLDFGGQPPPSERTEYSPVKEGFYQGMSLEQLILLGFNINVTQSKIVPLSTTNETRILLMAYSSNLAKFMGGSDWRINIGTWNDSDKALVADFLFTKIQYMMLMLQSFPGEQQYISNWALNFSLPVGHTLNDQSKLNELNWTIDFGEGTFMQTNVTEISGRIIVNEVMVVTERNITANETYLATALGQYKVFAINYSHPYTPPSKITKKICKPRGDWSKMWSYTIAPSPCKKTWRVGGTVGLDITMRATPILKIQWYMGWERKWTWKGYKLQWFESWMKITPSIKVEASLGVGVRYNREWTYRLLTLSNRFYFWAGSVPVWANLQLTVDAGIEFDAWGKISISSWVSLKTMYKAGVRWDATSGWRTIWDSDVSVSRGDPQISGSASLSVTPKLTCRLAFLIYDVGGPFVAAVPYAPMSIIYYHNQPNEWSIQLRFKIEAGVTFAGWLNKILKLASYSKTIKDWLLKSWSGYW
ncbi:MAG: hypothetical protein JSU57_00615 [Candidatus Heimdallarchaeota archaeon]|nr:MAG: hypothetical protein JSU57_00615 [Candidatus Heimdallarchaeota archaeon]